MTVEEKLKTMDLTLPQVAKPVASYVPAVRSGNLVYSSGQLPTKSGELPYRGKVGGEIDEDTAYEAARIAALNALAAIKSVIGDLDKIRRVVRVTGYVSSAMGFNEQPIVVNGASDFLVELFGQAGQHARTAIGVFQLPLDAPVEVELIVEVTD